MMTGNAERLGFDQQRLGRIDEWMDRNVEAGRFTGRRPAGFCGVSAGACRGERQVSERSPLEGPARLFARSLGRLLGIGYLLFWSAWRSLLGVR